MQLFFNPEANEESKSIQLSSEEGRHLIKVLRKKIGNPVIVANGKGQKFQCTLENPNPKKPLLKVESVEDQPVRTAKLHIAIAPTKMIDRFEWFLEKATEIGIERITPILCEHSERRNLKPERLQRIMITAMKQAQRWHLPRLDELQPFESFIDQKRSDQLFIAHCEPGDKQHLGNLIHVGENCLILIGPEGDFSVKEIEMALARDFKPVTLGQYRLRTETAAIVACEHMAFING